mmetsp:Transcript_84606/g.181259  ORF Transcript_84606/g.181259 Transcript_84606/m.181259 type:complete len:263 (+) Transcript_84606:1027-1815(+)
MCQRPSCEVALHLEIPTGSLEVPLGIGQFPESVLGSSALAPSLSCLCGHRLGNEAALIHELHASSLEVPLGVGQLPQCFLSPGTLTLGLCLLGGHIRIAPCQRLSVRRALAVELLLEARGECLLLAQLLADIAELILGVVQPAHEELLAGRGLFLLLLLLLFARPVNLLVAGGKSLSALRQLLPTLGVGAAKLHHGVTGIGTDPGLALPAALLPHRLQEPLCLRDPAGTRGVGQHSDLIGVLSAAFWQLSHGRRTWRSPPDA